MPSRGSAGTRRERKETGGEGVSLSEGGMNEWLNEYTARGRGKKDAGSLGGDEFVPAAQWGCWQVR